MQVIHLYWRRSRCASGATKFVSTLTDRKDSHSLLRFALRRSLLLNNSLCGRRSNLSGRQLHRPFFMRAAFRQKAICWSSGISFGRCFFRHDAYFNHAFYQTIIYSSDPRFSGREFGAIGFQRTGAGGSGEQPRQPRSSGHHAVGDGWTRLPRFG